MNRTEQKHPIGTLRISRDVIATIASVAATEVEGVQGLATAPVDFKGMLSKRRMIPKPVSIALSDDIAVIELHLILRQDARIPQVSERVQQAVKEAVQNMTSIAVSRVNIVVAGIAFADGEQEA
jgi:uncharacterized alkaline shock family protein YloU